MHTIALGLNHLHEKKILHRDLKPANVLLTRDGNLKIADLGLGRVFGTTTFEVFSKVGTPLYMSPELVKGSGYNTKTDIWSLGCILYELCEFQSPFRNQNEKISLNDLF